MPTELEDGRDTTEQKIYVLVVDDEPLLCRMISAMLIRAGYDTSVVNNGMDVLPSVMNRLPELITLDVMMPDMSGIEVASQLRSNPATAHIPIVFVTALDRSVSMDLRRFLEEPHVYHVDKPFSREQLLGQLMIALNTRQAVAV